MQSHIRTTGRRSYGPSFCRMRTIRARGRSRVTSWPVSGSGTSKRTMRSPLRRNRLMFRASSEEVSAPVSSFALRLKPWSEMTTRST